MKIKEILRTMCERDASDLFLKIDNVPYLRIYGELKPLQDFPSLSLQDLERFIAEIVDTPHRERLQSTRDHYGLALQPPAFFLQ